MKIWAHCFLLLHVSAAPVRRDFWSEIFPSTPSSDINGLDSSSPGGAVQPLNPPLNQKSPQVTTAATQVSGNDIFGNLFGDNVNSPGAVAPAQNTPNAAPTPVAATTPVTTTSTPAAAAAPASPAPAAPANPAPAAPPSPAPAAATTTAAPAATGSSWAQTMNSNLFSNLDNFFKSFGFNFNNPWSGSTPSSTTPANNQPGYPFPTISIPGVNQPRPTTAANPTTAQTTPLPSTPAGPVTTQGAPGSNTGPTSQATAPVISSIPTPQAATNSISTPAAYTPSSSAAIVASSSISVVSEVPQAAAGQSYSKVWGRFWDQSTSKWNSKDSACNSGKYVEPVVWEQAMIGKAVTNSQNAQNIQQTIANLDQYRNKALGAFSASTAGDDDIYTDDNAQVAWVYLDAYQQTNNQEYLQTAEQIINFITSQWASGNGGVYWQYQKPYIATISTTEAALAAVRLYEINNNATLLQFSQNCMDYMFKYMQDPSDKLFYDGVDQNDYSNINKGKLTYTVGVAMSALVRLNKATGNQYWLDQAVQLGTSAMNQHGAFYDDTTYWNNPLKYECLLFTGYADLLASGASNSAFGGFSQELKRQGAYIFNFVQDTADESMYFDSASDSSTQTYNKYKAAFSAQHDPYDGAGNTVCPNGIVEKVLINNAASIQILQALNRVG